MAAQTSAKKRKPIGANETFWGYIFLLPVILGFIVFTIFPVVMSFYYSLTDYDGVTPPKFIRIQNYIDLFTNGDFGEALWHTVYFTIGTVPKPENQGTEFVQDRFFHSGYCLLHLHCHGVAVAV